MGNCKHKMLLSRELRKGSKVCIATKSNFVSSKSGNSVAELLPNMVSVHKQRKIVMRSSMYSLGNLNIT